MDHIIEALVVIIVDNYIWIHAEARGTPILMAQIDQKFDFWSKR